MILAERFIFRSWTVTRPLAVTPRISPLRTLKWSSQRSTRGLNKGVICPDSGSIEVMSLPLNLLQTAQHSARFPATVRPPCFTATTWSISCSANVNRSEIRQYSHSPPARNRTSARSAGSISDIAGGTPEFQLSGRFCHPDKVFEILVSLPFLFVLRCHFPSAASLDYFRHSSRQARRRAQVQDLFRCRQRGKKLQNIGGAVKPGLITGVEFPETEFEDSRELVPLCLDSRCQIVRKT